MYARREGEGDGAGADAVCDARTVHTSSSDVLVCICARAFVHACVRACWCVYVTCWCVYVHARSCMRACVQSGGRIRGG
jgi:hypothetical protein